jgi:hypothetical protein
MSVESTRIAATIADMRDNLAGISTFLMVLNSSRYETILNEYGIDPGSTIELGRLDGSRYTSLDVYKSVGRIRGNPQFNLDYIGVFLMATVSLIADGLAQNSYFARTPELEFLRHLRNAISHGNRFHFRHGEPTRPASFRGFTITKQLEGKRPFWEYMAPGDALDLLDEVELQLRAIP